MEHKKICFIGAGNMASCIIGGLANTEYPTSNISASDPNSDKVERLANLHQIKPYTNNVTAVQGADIVIFAVKPQHLNKALLELKQTLCEVKPLIISIAAGIKTSQIEHWLDSEAAVVRAMPNTPALMSCGATGMYANEHVDENQCEVAESILRAIGITAWIEEENLMDVVTALSGSGPAYFFAVMEALEIAASNLGLPPDIARLFTMQTAAGAAKIALESDEDVAILKQKVTSPGGTTEAALAVLDAADIKGTFTNAVTAARDRGEELSKAFDK